MVHTSTPTKALESAGNSVDVGASPEVPTTPTALDMAQWLERDGATCDKHLQAAAMLRMHHHACDYYSRLCDQRLQQINALREDNATLLSAVADVTTGNSVDVDPAAAESTTPEEDDTIGIITTKIGDIDHGIDGKDTYVLMERKGVSLTHEYAHAWLVEHFYTDCSRAGGYYCKEFLILPMPYSNSMVVGVIKHRFDV